ncbi:thiamine diphosphokinase [Cytobacillus depressus]|uniref:Thiamine diphosphokinase n=1 Tax=Cytobacillus depressus TaxID=1602942 RepID=A0A6L3V7Q3_9BACI|nr:thiamine diphosphokinase [Cytobacillus depressus]KAB2337464.1 thiamine diphosphokinase [Cytobacillus depressus]
MNINILGGGPVELLPNLNKFNHDDNIWVGVDRGVFTLITKGILPAIAFGDFDSVSQTEMAVIEENTRKIRQYRPEKDETDMELALNWAIDQNPKLIRIFGATGGRLDHFFANIQLLINPTLHKKDIQIEMIDQRNIVFVKGPGTYSIKKTQELKYVSFLPITLEVSDLTLKGFKYPLKDKHIPMGSTLCISNELISDNGNFSFSKGIIMVVRSND